MCNGENFVNLNCVNIIFYLYTRHCTIMKIRFLIFVNKNRTRGSCGERVASSYLDAVL